MSQKFELVLYTAASKEYANAVIKVLDPHSTIFRHKLYRDSCLLTSVGFTKPLEPLNRDMNKIILVDNTPFSFILNSENGIHVSSYIDSDSDHELESLAKILRVMEEMDDTRFLSAVRQQRLSKRH
jgi:Dullard-like phosphatase family protein